VNGVRRKKIWNNDFEKKKEVIGIQCEGKKGVEIKKKDQHGHLQGGVGKAFYQKGKTKTALGGERPTKKEGKQKSRKGGKKKERNVSEKHLWGTRGGKKNPLDLPETLIREKNEGGRNVQGGDTHYPPKVSQKKKKAE